MPYIKKNDCENPKKHMNIHTYYLFFIFALNWVYDNMVKTIFKYFNKQKLNRKNC